ncbi:MAG: sortase, partial [Candidatus Dojkabacteria bacterium]
SQHTVEQFDMLLNIIENSSLEVALPNQIFSDFGYAEGLTPELEIVNAKSYDGITPEDFQNDVSLEIPKLEIVNSLEIVCQDSQDVYDFSKLHEAPILICPSASPYLEDIGVPGASIIIGHRQWGITPKIFAKLDRMQINDSVSIKTQNLGINFMVIELIEILPEDLWKTVAMYHNLGIEDEKSYLILITCTPYGTDWRRLLVVSERSYNEESTIVSNSSGSQ